MTAVLVVLTIMLFLGIDLWRNRAHRRASMRASDALRPILDVDGFALPQGLFVGPGHTWARLEGDGSIVMGIDELANALLGPADRLRVAARGTELSKHDAAFVAHRGDRSLAFAAPIDGRVTEVNLDALKSPSRVHDAPYGAGWLLRLQPSRLARDLPRLRIGDDARDWLRHEVKRVGDFVAHQAPDLAVGVSMADGGVPVAHVLDHLDAAAWERFEQEFLLGA